MNLQFALWLQLALYAVAIVAALVAIGRAVKLQRQVAQHGSDWWQTAEARVLVGHALRPLWLTVAALLVGAFAPRLLGMLGG